MARKVSVSPTDPSVNSHLDGNGDAAEQAHGTEDTLAFDPAELQADDSADQTLAPASGSAEPRVVHGPDPFDPESLRLPADFNAGICVRRALLSVPHRKPDKSWFVRVHPDKAYRLQTCVIELKEERESYLVARNLWSELATEATFKQKLLVTAINRQNVVFLWEANLPRPDGRIDEWARTNLEGIERASKRWVRIVANMSLGAYDLLEASGELGEPEWPTASLNELLRISFKGQFIDNQNHPVLRRLRGEV